MTVYLLAAEQRPARVLRHRWRIVVPIAHEQRIEDVRVHPIGGQIAHDQLPLRSADRTHADHVVLEADARLDVEARRVQIEKGQHIGGGNVRFVLLRYGKVRIAHDLLGQIGAVESTFFFCHH